MKTLPHLLILVCALCSLGADQKGCTAAPVGQRLHASAAGVSAVSRTALLLLGLLIGLVGGTFIGRKLQGPANPTMAVRHEPAPFGQPPHDYMAERALLNSTKAQLAIRMAYAQPSSDREAGDALTPAQQLEAEQVERLRQYREVLREHKKEVVIVRRADHTISAYPVGEPIPDGIIVARRLPSGEMAWYSGSGSRDDPASFRIVPPPVFERAADGTLMVNGKPRSPGLQHMFLGTKKHHLQ